MEHLAEHTSEGFFLTPAPCLEIPDKLYFRTGEVARLAAIKPYVLRFWETEFPTLGPKKSGTGHRLYRRKDVEMVLEIKRLLYEKRFTIAGARQTIENGRKEAKRNEKRRLEGARRQGELFPTPGILIGELRRELREILSLLNQSAMTEDSLTGTAVTSHPVVFNSHIKACAAD